MVTKLEFHPVADLFPMLADDELAELAEDIKQRGLIQPIVLDGQGRVLDGRNRLAACHRAGVEPEFITYEGADADGYALAVNVQRRQMTKGQRAMVIVSAEDFSGKNLGGRDVGASEISKARLVWKHARDLAARVLDATMPLNDAYEIARDRKRDAEQARAKLERLRADAPDLASHVDDERMSLDDAIAALDAREERVRQEAEQARRDAEERASEEERQRRENERKRADEQRDARALLSRIVELTAPQAMADGFIDAWADRLGDLDADLIRRTEQAGLVLLDLAERTKR